MTGTSPVIAEFEHAGHQVRLALPSESDHISAQILASKSFYELAFLQALRELVKPGDLVLDVGANIGNHTVYFAVIAKCRVMAFEPVASTCAFLRQNVQLNGVGDQVQVLEIALGESEGDAAVASFDAANLGATRLKLDAAGDIRIDTIDHLETDGAIRLIKIDAEGMDASVVAGASKTLARDRPIVACEAATQAEYQRLCRLLEAQAYVSVACFNATDTFVFMPASTADERLSLVRHGFDEIISLQRGVRALDGRFAQMGRYAERVARESQGHAVTKAAELVVQSADLLRGDLTEKTDAALRDLRHAIEKRLEALGAELEASTAQISGMQQEAQDEIRSKLEKIQVSHRTSLEARVAEVRAELEFRTAQLKADQQEMGEAIDFRIEQAQIAQQSTLDSRIQMASAEWEERTAQVREEQQRMKESISMEMQRVQVANRQSQEVMRQALLVELQQQQAMLHQLEEQVDSQHATGARQLDQVLVQLTELAVELRGTKSDLASVLVAREEAAARASSQLREAKVQLESTRAVLEERQQQLAAEREHLEAMRQAQRKSETDMAALRARLGSEVMEKNRWQQVAATASTNTRSATRLVEMYGRSITFQVGSAVQASFRSVTDMFKLPVRMFRIAREKTRRRAFPNEAPADWRIVVPVQMPAPLETPAFAMPVDVPSPPPSPEALIASPEALTRSTAIPVVPTPISGETVSPVQHAPRLPLLPRHVGELRLAAIMDEFTFSSYGPCCSVEQLLPATWRQQLDTVAPHMLFVESAWQGKNGAWQGKVVHSSPELEGILEWCRVRRIPTLFWNKEDPVHFETFVGFAQRFDYVFTTDIDCIGRYKAALGHDRIFLLPFACQPLNHNPIEKYERKNAFCFAGAYYARYPERQKDFDVFIDTLSVMAPVEIFDRNHGKDHPDYMFPERYRKLILGNLTFDQIDLAYKGYQYAINLNSVK